MPNTPNPTRRRRPIWVWMFGIFAVVIVAIVALWDWDWFLPILDRQASAALGRNVTAQHLHVQLGRITTVVLDDVEIAAADAGTQPFATLAKLTVQADIMAYIHTRQIVLPQIVLDQPVIEATQDAQGHANWPAPTTITPSDTPADPNAGPKIGQLVIVGGQAHVVIAKVKADFQLAIATRQADAAANTPDAQAGQIVVDAKGTYAAQPITGHLVGGALLSLRDSAAPYPIDMKIANGPTHVSLTGTVQNPLNFAGADLRLQFTGPDMALLTPLTGVPIPQTPAYSIAGKLDYAAQKIRFTGFTGRLGNSDLNGDITVDPTGPRPVVEANLFSRTVELADLGGFIGETPGKKTEAAQSPQQKAELAKKEASGRVLPDTPINVPKLTIADIRLQYKGAHIQGRSVPLDNIVAKLAITNGVIQLDPLSFGVGTGQIELKANLTPVGNELKADATIAFKRVSLARLLEATHLVEGAGTISGTARLVSTGNSMATLLGRGDGGLRVGMAGGNLSALLVDIAGLEFGNAILSSLGIPQRADLRCFVGDFGLNRGLLATKTMIVDTSEARVQGAGTLNLANETIDYKLRTASKHFSVGSLATPIDIGGTFRQPSIAPEVGPLAMKGAAAAGLGVLFPPAALLPTIQFGTGDDNVCTAAEAPIAAGKPVAPPVHRAPLRRRKPSAR